MTNLYEYIVVGSGPTGAMAAQTLVESGVDILMLDVGITDTTYPSTIPDKDYLSIRQEEDDQYKYLIGRDLEGISWGKVGKGEQITPPRKYILEESNTLLPVRSKNFSVVESLAYGGLGSGWGIGCWTWSTTEMVHASLNPDKMQLAYQTVLDRIGISATPDDAQDYTIGNLTRYDRSATLDKPHSRIYAAYKHKQLQLKRKGFIMGRPPLALITKDRNDRKKYAYKEMEYYTDKDKSAYRPWITVDALRKKQNFTYIGNKLVISFREIKDSIEVVAIDTVSKKEVVYTTKKLILAAGIFGTARIVLRSQNTSKSTRLPLLANPYSYLPCIQPFMLGKPAEKRKLGFANLSLFLDEKGDNADASMASLYGYQSLMLFRMARQVPLNFRDTRPLLQYLISGLVIMGIHHPDRPSAQKYVRLIPDASSITNDTLDIHYHLSDQETAENKRREKKYISAMRSMGVFPLKKFNPGNGASIHYAGTLPFSRSPKPFTLSATGKLHGTKRVFVADGSGFTYLPAKGLTFTLMANAHIIAQEALND